MKKIYQCNQIKQVDQMAAEYLQISSFQLMRKAGISVFSYVCDYSNILIVAGAGNNAGDGYIVAKEALKNDITVKVWALVAIDDLPIDAQMAAQQYLHAGGEIIYQIPQESFECIVDALLGTGLNRDVSGDYEQAIKWINLQPCEVVSIDVPSGLNADYGTIQGCSIKANRTVTILGYKAGLLTNYGKECCGQLFCEELDIPEAVFDGIGSRLMVLDESLIHSSNFIRNENSHKGTFGKVLIAGGHDGMLGALMLAGQAALRSGCGSVEVVSNSEQCVLISLQCPELITSDNINSSRFLDSADVIAVGPGLGLDLYSVEVLEHCIAQRKPMVIDADALTLIAQEYQFNHDVVLTPHPKEAATLLETDVSTIQKDRIAAAIEISEIYSTCVILKGSGSVVAQSNGEVFICPYGDSTMATAGMGDVLTGIVAGLMGQGFNPFDAAKTAVVWHAKSAERSNMNISLMASDVLKNMGGTLL